MCGICRIGFVLSNGLKRKFHSSLVVVAIPFLLASSLMCVASAEQSVSADKSQTPVIFASFSGSFATLHEILPLEKWECLRETRGGPASFFSLLFHMHRAAIEFDELKEGRGFRIAWAFVPNTRRVICVYSQSLSPDAVISSLANRQGSMLPKPDEESFTLFPWGGYLSRVDHISAITLSLPPDEKNNAGLEPNRVRDFLTALDTDYMRMDAPGDLTLAFNPSLVPADIREFWTSTVLAGLTSLMQKRDGESESGFQIRRALAQTEVYALQAFLFQRRFPQP